VKPVSREVDGGLDAMIRRIELVAATRSTVFRAGGSSALDR